MRRTREDRKVEKEGKKEENAEGLSLFCRVTMHPAPGVTTVSPSPSRPRSPFSLSGSLSGAARMFLDDTRTASVRAALRQIGYAAIVANKVFYRARYV